MSRRSHLLADPQRLRWIYLLVALSLAFALGAIPISAQVTEDLSHGASFQFKIGPGLPEFTFKVIPRTSASDGDDTESMIGKIEVYRGDSKLPLQRLTGCNWSGMELPPRGSDWVRTEDINFDGYNDVYVMTSWGATGNQWGCIWLYNQGTGRFDYSKEFSELPGHGLDPATKTIQTFTRGGMAGLVFGAGKYKVEKNKPVLIMRVNQDWSSEKKQFHCVVEERQGTAMAVTREEWSKPGDESIEGVAPCDPGELLGGTSALSGP